MISNLTRLPQARAERCLTAGCQRSCTVTEADFPEPRAPDCDQMVAFSDQNLRVCDRILHLVAHVRPVKYSDAWKNCESNTSPAEHTLLLAAAVCAAGNSAVLLSLDQQTRPISLTECNNIVTICGVILQRCC